MAYAPFPITPELTAVAIGYKPQGLIADGVLPRVPVSKQSFKYRKFDVADNFTIPDTKVGRVSAPNRAEYGFTEVTDSTVDYALDDPIPMADIENALNYSPEGRAVEVLSNLIALDREVRTANLVFNASSFGTNNKTTLSGTTQWSDKTNSDPVNAILTGLDSCTMRPNILVLGQAVWTQLRTHPKIVQACLGTAATAGIVPKQAVQDLFELEEIYVGQSFVNSAKKGQSVSLSRAWGKFAALIYRDRLADASTGCSFGFTAQFGDRVAGAIEDKNIGMRGGVVVRVGESVKELVTANDLGYLWSAAVA